MKLKAGDIFIMEAVKNKLSAGQILSVQKASIYLCIFKRLYNSKDEINLDHALMDEIIVVARTFNIFFNLKRWNVIGNRPIIERNDIYPNYKIETLQGVFITTFNRQVIRKANKDEEDFYFFYNDYTPAVIVAAVQAVFGEIPMTSHYEKLTFDFVSKRSNSLN